MEDCYGGSSQSLLVFSHTNIIYHIKDSVTIHEMAHSYFGDSLVCKYFEHSWLKVIIFFLAALSQTHPHTNRNHGLPMLRLCGLRTPNQRITLCMNCMEMHQDISWNAIRTFFPSPPPSKLPIKIHKKQPNKIAMCGL